MDIKEYVTTRSKLVNEKLEELFPKSGPGIPILRESMYYSLVAGGKRLRPVLCILGYELSGGQNIDEVMPQACALEMIHTFTLIHDDLPAMDDDDFRRGKPSNHKVYGEAAAILAGDALFVEAVGIFLQGVIPDELKVRMLEVLVNALGVDGVIGGQVLDIRAEGRVHTRNLVESIHLRKTARFIEASLVIGAIGARAAESTIEKLKTIGIDLGVLFQIIDDILDETGEERELGKKLKKDHEGGKCTYPKVMGLDNSIKEAKKLTEKVKIEAKAAFGEKGELLEELAEYFLNRRN